jgi:hypothetical protein
VLIAYGLVALDGEGELPGRRHPPLLRRPKQAQGGL